MNLMQEENNQPIAISWQNWGYRHASRNEFAVRNLNLDIHEGEHVLLLGASGIGKSTILEGAAGILGDEVAVAQSEPAAEDAVAADDDAAVDDAACAECTAGADDAVADVDAEPQALVDADGGITEGSISIYGADAHQAHGQVGLVLQDPDAQVVFQRIGDNVAFGPENLDVPREQIWQRVAESLQAVGLEDIQLTRSVLHLSGGQMQRLALAGALAMQPKVLLLDEPTANLDPAGVTEVVQAVSDVLQRTKATMVLVEHRAGAWIDCIDRVIVLGNASDEAKHTVVVADGTPEAVFTNPAIDFAELGIWVPEQYRRPSDVIRPLSQAAANTTSAATHHEVVLHTEDLAIGRNNEAIADHINLEFRTGEITALVGANGAGKSTLSLTLAGLLEPVAGSVVASPALAEGTKHTEPWPIHWTSRELASRISYVFQNPEHQFACSSVLDEVMLGPIRTGIDEDQAREQAMQLLEQFRLDQYAQVNPYTLSGGEKRRLTVAAALACAPSVLLLDEPTFGQDRRTWMQIARLIDSLRNDGVSIIVVTHDRDLVTALGARVVELVPEFSTEEWGSSSNQSIEASHTEKAAAVATPLRAGEAKSVSALRAGVESGATSLRAEVSSDVSALRVGEDDATALRAGNEVNTAFGLGVGETTVPVSAVRDRVEEPRQSSRSSFLASLNPVYRLIGAFLVSLPLLLSLDVVSASVALAIEVIVLWLLGITPWRVVRSTWPIFIGAPTSALAVLLYGKSGGAVWWQWAWINITDRSAMLALATMIRILAIGIPAIVLVLGIDATDLADAFSQILHLPDRFVYGGLAGMRLFAVLRDDWSALTASRRSRGLGDESAWRAFFPQAFALLVLSIRRSTMLATAMQARGFGGSGPRSHARVSTVHARDYWFVVGALLIPVVALVAAACMGTFAFMGGE
ncbi:ATP-binding cassette domain-containing protein [Bifidobacterium dolichotidis]|nr:ATP-binding cassette domain-containing protein [Bifidobacterium dolichotidis]